MSIITTCIGAYPKPDYTEIGNFAETGIPDDGVTRAFSDAQDDADEVPEELLLQATAEAIREQLDCGLTILGRTLAMAKLENMCAAAARI